jgi:hypothetical protein
MLAVEARNAFACDLLVAKLQQLAAQSIQEEGTPHARGPAGAQSIHRWSLYKAVLKLRPFLAVILPNKDGRKVQTGNEM